MSEYKEKFESLVKVNRKLSYEHGKFQQKIQALEKQNKDMFMLMDRMATRLHDCGVFTSDLRREFNKHKGRK